MSRGCREKLGLIEGDEGSVRLGLIEGRDTVSMDATKRFQSDASPDSEHGWAELKDEYEDLEEIPCSPSYAWKMLKMPEYGFGMNKQRSLQIHEDNIKDLVYVPGNRCQVSLVISRSAVDGREFYLLLCYICPLTFCQDAKAISVFAIPASIVTHTQHPIVYLRGMKREE